MKGRLGAFMLALLCAFPVVLSGCGTSGPPDFVLSLATDQPSSVVLTQGQTTPINFQVSALKGSTGSITLTVSGLPMNVGVAPGVATVGIGSPQSFNLTVDSTAKLQSTPVTLTATGVSGNPLDSSSITHTVTLTVTVVAPATTGSS